MDAMYLTYFEEMDELLQRAEECLIRLEAGQSRDDINELFRIAHSIKGSSMMIGFEPIGNLTHKLEDLLDSARKDRIRLDGDVLRLCFDGLDCVKVMVESGKASVGGEFDPDHLTAAGRLGREIDQLLGRHAGPEAESGGPGRAGDGIVGTLREAGGAGKHRLYISVFFSDDAPMIQAVLYMIFRNIREIGTLEYTNISDDDIFAAVPERPVTSCVMILNTDREADELYPCFEVMYVDKVEIIDISDDVLRNQAVCRDRQTLEFFERFFDGFRMAHPVLFDDRQADKASLRKLFRDLMANLAARGSGLPPDDVLPDIRRFHDQCSLLLAGSGKVRPELAEHLRREYMALLERVYGHVRGRLIFKVVRARDRGWRNWLGGVAERMDRSRVRRLFVDVSGLSGPDRDDLAELIAVRRSLRGAGITVDIIAGKPMNKRLVNVLDAIRPVEDFAVYGTELEAVLGDARKDRSGERDGEMDQYHVMILDGEASSAALRKALEAAGFRRVDAFSDPGEAMAAFRDRKYHIVLADMDLPGMDGIAILERVRQYDPMAQVIMMTAGSTIDRVLACLELGANDYVLKPFKSERTIAEVVTESARKLERWKEALRETVLRQTAAEGEERQS